MRKLTKLIREANKIAKHCFKNMNLKKRLEPVDYYMAEGYM